MREELRGAAVVVLFVIAMRCTFVVLRSGTGSDVRTHVVIPPSVVKGQVPMPQEPFVDLSQSFELAAQVHSEDERRRTEIVSKSERNTPLTPSPSPSPSSSSSRTLSIAVGLVVAASIAARKRFRQQLPPSGNTSAVVKATPPSKTTATVLHATSPPHTTIETIDQYLLAPATETAALSEEGHEVFERMRELERQASDQLLRLEEVIQSLAAHQVAETSAEGN